MNASWDAGGIDVFFLFAPLSCLLTLSRAWQSAWIRLKVLVSIKIQIKDLSTDKASIIFNIVYLGQLETILNYSTFPPLFLLVWKSG